MAKRRPRPKFKPSELVRKPKVPFCPDCDNACNLTANQNWESCECKGHIPARIFNGVMARNG